MKWRELIVHVFGSENSNSEFEQLEKWKNNGELNATKLKEMSLLHTISEDLKDYKSFDVEGALATTMGEIDVSTPKSNIRKYILSGLFLAVLIFVSVYFAFFNSNIQQYHAETIIVEHELEDGSFFVMKEGSTLDFERSINEMSLLGEAFFDIEKQKTPLIIRTTFGDITVLGTSFNVESTSDYAEIFMFEGVISFKAEGAEEVKVSQGEGVRVDARGVKTFINSASQSYEFWRTKELVYKNEPLTNVLNDLQRLFDKEFKIINEIDDSLLISATFSGLNVSRFVEELEVITGLEIN